MTANILLLIVNRLSNYQIKDPELKNQNNHDFESEVVNYLRYKATFYKVLVLIALGIVSCDSFKEDIIQPNNQITFGQTEFYTLPGSSIVIDMRTIVHSSFTQGSLTITQGPLRGELTPLDAYLLKYKPAFSFWEGFDGFTFTVESNGEILTSERITIYMREDVNKFPCSVYANQDRAHAVPGLTASVDVLDNDRLCGTNSPGARVYVHIGPHFGTSSIEDNTRLVYNPGTEYAGTDEIVYRIESASNETVGYGIVTVNDNWIARALKLPDFAYRMLFVDENVGFIAGQHLYKTTDGGANWKVVYLSDNIYYSFTDIFFLDANNGFVTYQSCDGLGTNCTSDLLSTTDGGTSWKRTHFENLDDLLSVYFTSATTGFLGAIDWDTESSPMHLILKTEDGGASWRPVFDNHGRWEQMDIEFESPTIGYACQGENVFKTTNAGESWELSYHTSDYITDIAVVPDDIVCGAFARSILRSAGGANWSTNSVVSPPFQGLKFGFSASGEIGFAIAVYYTQDRYRYEELLSISRSLDKGATWETEDLDEPLFGEPVAVSIPSDKVAYFLCSDKIIKYERP